MSESEGNEELSNINPDEDDQDNTENYDYDEEDASELSENMEDKPLEDEIDASLSDEVEDVMQDHDSITTQKILEEQKQSGHKRSIEEDLDDVSNGGSLSSIE